MKTNMNHLPHETPASGFLRPIPMRSLTGDIDMPQRREAKRVRIEHTMKGKVEEEQWDLNDLFTSPKAEAKNIADEVDRFYSPAIGRFSIFLILISCTSNPTS
jgi:hypothetical protein